MNKLKVTAVTANEILFENGIKLYSDHNQDCCESHYLDLTHISISDFKGLEFDLSNDDFFERIEDYGIALKPINRFPVRIPGYGSNNGWYSSNLSLVLTDGKDFTKIFDIAECQNINWY